MMRIVLSFPRVLPMILICATSVVGQSAYQTIDSETCKGPVYRSSNGSPKATILFRPDVNYTEEAVANGVRGRVVVEAVLCRTGRVTDIKVVEGLGYGMTEAVVNAVRRYRFTPAELDWHTVSQLLQIEYRFGLDDAVSSTGEAVGLVVESIHIVGNRILTEAEILSWVKTRVGEPFNTERVMQDLYAINGKGYFNKSRSRVITEAGKQGGTVLIFEVQELPRISEVKFVGLNDIADFKVLDSFKKENPEIVRGGVYDLDSVGRSTRVLERLLLSVGRVAAKVEIQTEQVDLDHVVLKYVVKRK